MHTSISSSFADRPAARAAAEMLVADGIPRDRIALHENVSAVRNSASMKADELLTGGFVGNFGNLLDTLFDKPPSGDASTYQDLVKSEGAVLSIDVADDPTFDIERCRQLLRNAGAIRVSTLPQPGASG